MMDPVDEITNQFQMFTKQADAFEVLKKHPGRRCFSVELPNSGGPHGALRKFLISDLAGFWMWYRNQYNGPRHFYELIQEGYPCRLYFDLEYQKEDNPNLVESEILDAFVNLINELVEEHYSFKISKKNWLILDSTTDSKFSAHAVVHFPENYIFPNNVAMRTFIQALLQKMSDTGIGIVKKEDQETFLCDPAVYTKNRVFRLFLSSKAGRKISLQLKKGCTFYDKPPKDDRTIFLDSLVIPHNYKNCPLLKVAENPHIVLKQTRMNGPMKIAPIYSIVSRPQSHQTCQNLSMNMELVRMSSGISPLPELDEFVIQFNRRFVKNVTIRLWQYFILKPHGSKRVQYQIYESLLCNNVLPVPNLENIVFKARIQLPKEEITEKELEDRFLTVLANSGNMKKNFTRIVRKKCVPDYPNEVDFYFILRPTQSKKIYDNYRPLYPGYFRDYTDLMTQKNLKFTDIKVIKRFEFPDVIITKIPPRSNSENHEYLFVLFGFIVLSTVAYFITTKCSRKSNMVETEYKNIISP